MNEAIEQMLSKYHPSGQKEYENALKEILQEIILSGLDRSSFFEKAAFYGDSALRIHHQLDRFSEDLDFTLLASDKNFKLEKYFSGVKHELKAFGLQFELVKIEKTKDHLIESAFLKTNTQLIFLDIDSTKSFAGHIQKEKKIKIKFEVDIMPPVGFDTEIKTLLLPAPYTVKVLTPPSLFAGKMHAALLRNWKNRIKGRDFYDIQWFMARNIPLHKKYLEEKLKASGALKEALTKKILVDLFSAKTESLNWEMAREDVLPFLKDKNQVRLWSASFFKELISKIELLEK